MTIHMKKTWFVDGQIIEEQIPEEAIYDPSWCIEYCKSYAEQLRDKTRANRAEHAAQCIEYLLSLVQKGWVGLTEDERMTAMENCTYDGGKVSWNLFGMAIEKKIKDKNHE